MPPCFGPSQANRITSHDANGALLLQQVADRYDIPVPAILAYVCTLGKCPHIVVLLLTLTVSLVRTGMPTSRNCQPCYRPAQVQVVAQAAAGVASHDDHLRAVAAGSDRQLPPHNIAHDAAACASTTS